MTDAGRFLMVSESASMVAAGRDSEGVAHTILVDSDGRAICARDAKDVKSGGEGGFPSREFILVFLAGYIFGRK